MGRIRAGPYRTMTLLGGRESERAVALIEQVLVVVKGL
jgi:hypothetical protein